MASNADTTGTDDTTAVEIDKETARAVRPSGDDSAVLPHHSFLSRLYSGTGAFEVIGRRRLWYTISGVIVAIAVISILVRGFTFGIDFKGGTTMSMPASVTRDMRRSARSRRSSGRRWAATPRRW